MTPLQLFGRLHPLVLHFPIALLLLAAAVEVVRCFRDAPLLSRATIWLLALGALGAAAAAVTGWVFAYESHPERALRAVLAWHRCLGISTAVMAALASGVAARWAGDVRSGFRWFARSAIWLLAAILIITAHLGALVVWGLDYYS